MEKDKNEYYIVSVEDTIKYGIIPAAIIGRIRWWCQHNKDKKIKDRHYNNEWWSGFMSSKEFSEQLGMPVKTIEKHLSLLIKSNIIIKDVFNKKKYDRTGWYRVNPFPPIEDTIYSNRGNGITTIEEMDLLQLGEPIPVNQTVNQTLNQTLNPPVNSSVELTETDKEQLLELIKNIIAPNDKFIGLVETLIIDGADFLTNANKELILKNKHYFNKGTLLPKVIQQLEIN